jgi:hypothetical protein
MLIERLPWCTIAPSSNRRKITPLTCGRTCPLEGRGAAGQFDLQRHGGFLHDPIADLTGPLSLGFSAEQADKASASTLAASARRRGWGKGARQGGL